MPRINAGHPATPNENINFIAAIDREAAEPFIL
jgi:hypothetical protein